MKKFLLVVLGVLILSSCEKYDYSLDSLGYSESVFGVKFNQNQDWNTATNGSIYIYADNVAKMQILASFLEADSTISIKLLNQTSSNGYINFDVPDNYQDLFAAFVDDEGKGIYKRFDINAREVNPYSSNLTRSLSQEYVLPDGTLILDGTVESFASQRGWIPNEVFYTFDNPELQAIDYDSDFKTVFRTIIFNYFPNGRRYNNLPLIKKSGYYNESTYPITTGDEPIIVSPVYKNDGGYHEISEAELYYYYFTGDLDVQDIEALPKYRAIDLSNVYSNEDNDNIVKNLAYALVYWEGNQGSFQFPKGYKIGFMYKSNTTTDNKKKQGELYGDGRLNYNINSWGNFKSSNLGPTEPRMAWMTVNNKMFLCVESGTDADFNDLICEVEGGIEPIIIIPDEPEHQFYTFCYEDRRLGDYDLNDVIIKGTRLDETHVEWTLMACGANDELYIKNILGNIINDNTEVHALFGKPLTCFINTEKKDNTPYIKDTVTVLNTFSFIDVDCHPIVYDKTMNWTVSIARKGEDPHAIMIPYNFRWPLERICVKDAYLKFNSWGTSLIEDTDWYLYLEDTKVK